MPIIPLRPLLKKRRLIKRSQKPNLITLRLHLLRDLETKDGSETVACDSVWSLGLLRFYGGVEGGDVGGYGGEEGLVVEAAGAEGVDWAGGDALGEREEDEDFADAGVD